MLIFLIEYIYDYGAKRRPGAVSWERIEHTAARQGQQEAVETAATGNREGQPRYDFRVQATADAGLNESRARQRRALLETCKVPDSKELAES